MTSKATKRPQGRPPRRDNPTRLVVRIPARLKDRLRLAAFRGRRDMGGLVAEALTRYLQRKP